VSRETEKLRTVAATLGALGLGFAASGAALELWLGGFDVVRSSAGAWLMLNVHRVLLAGDMGVGCCVSMNPSTFSNPAYPLAVAGLAESLRADWIRVGHWLSAGSVGIAAVSMFALWRPLVGKIAGTAAAAAVLFPPFLALAALARYDAPALALVLLCGWSAAAAARDGRARSWVIPGVLAGLAYNTREFMAAPALGALFAGLIAAGLMDRRRVRSDRRRRLRLLGAWLAAGLPAAATAFGLPTAVGLHPLGGLDSVLEYAAVSPSELADAHASLAQVLYLSDLGLPLLLGLGGLVAASLRRERRPELWVLWGMLLPFGLFLISGRQSAVYYLLLHTLLLAGCAGWLKLLPWWPARAALGLAAAGWLGAAAARDTPTLVGGGTTTFYESEAWPVTAAQAAGAMRWAHEAAGDDAALIVSSRYLENADALTELYHGRPSAFLFDPASPDLRRVVSLFADRRIVLLYLEQRGRDAEDGLGDLIPDGLTLADTWDSGTSLEARLYEVDPAAFKLEPVPDCWDRTRMPSRGACLQAAWLDGGEAKLRARLEALPTNLPLARLWQPCW